MSVGRSDPSKGFDRSDGLAWMVIAQSVAEVQSVGAAKTAVGPSSVRLPVGVFPIRGRDCPLPSCAWGPLASVKPGDG